MLALPHYRPGAVVVQTLIHLAQAVFGRPDCRTWHLLIAASAVLFLDPWWLEEWLGWLQGLLQPAPSHGPGRSSVSGAAGAPRRRRAAPRRGSETGAGVGRAPSASGSPGAPGEAAGSGAAARARKRPLQPRPSPATAAFVFLYVLVQALVPLRHLAVADFPVEWGREGHEFSWRAGGGSGGRAGGGGLVREDSLVRIIHHPRQAGARKGPSAGEVMNVNLYGSPLSAQQASERRGRTRIGAKQQSFPGHGAQERTDGTACIFWRHSRGPWSRSRCQPPRGGLCRIEDRGQETSGPPPPEPWVLVPPSRRRDA